MKIRKIKIQGTLPKMGVWLPTLLAMHAQTKHCPPKQKRCVIPKKITAP